MTTTAERIQAAEELGVKLEFTTESKLELVRVASIEITKGLIETRMELALLGMAFDALAASVGALIKAGTSQEKEITLLRSFQGSQDDIIADLLDRVESLEAKNAAVAGVLAQPETDEDADEDEDEGDEEDEDDEFDPNCPICVAVIEDAEREADAD